MVAIFKDTNGNVIDKTSSDWKAQTFYTAPITNLTCATENGALRLSHTCSTIPTNAGSAYYGLHWSRPINWMEANFDASIFPNASVFTNNTVGVNSKPAYTNFVDVFDDPTNDAQFIWSSNLILDNEIIVHHTVAVANLNDLELIKNSVDLYPNPTKDEFHLSLGGQIKPGDITSVDLYNSFGKRILSINSNFSTISTIGLDSGYYSVIIKIGEQQIIQKLFIY